MVLGGGAAAVWNRLGHISGMAIESIDASREVVAVESLYKVSLRTNQHTVVTR
jgi:hypothetical protein